MREEGKESRAAPGAAALDRADGYAEDSGGLCHGIALHVHQHQSRALVHREPGQGRQQLSVEVPALRGCLRGLMRLQQLLQALRVVHGGGTAAGRLARPVETGIDGDAVQPCRDGGLAAEGMSGPEGGDQRVLDRVRGLLTVPQRAHGNGPEPVSVAPYQLTEGVRIAVDMSGQEFLVARVGECGLVQR
jgi:hypothetical protein